MSIVLILKGVAYNDSFIGKRSQLAAEKSSRKHGTYNCKNKYSLKRSLI